ncbi:DUF1826 domain-containing protein [Erythrobacter rubeus]|uniref:DUF1826 domain-containing protein n=1 Tax=Erythrobacter rubeus TaxID=2760803 RepID=UPI002E29EF6D|nr:DUF1826 domain-containing protein [Erythrobacter rubeus]
MLQFSAAISASSNILRDVLDPACNLAIWERKSHRPFEDLLSGDVRDVRFRAAPLQLRERQHDELASAGYADVAERDELIADVSVLADHYCAILGLAEVEVRLEVVTTNSCRKWHADYVKARLITTYVGSGTQWLCQQDAARMKQGDEPRNINSMSPGNVGIFKGKLATDTPAIHRSPPIDGTGEKRLLLVLNPPEED